MEDQMYIIIAKVLHGEASEAERGQLEAWLQADARNRQEFEEIKAGWSEADALLSEPSFNTDLAWQKVSARLQAPVQEAAPQKGRTIGLPNWVKYTSALAAILLIAVLFFNPFSNDTVRVLADAGTRRVELPDHSIITLREGSAISYPEAFAASERNLTLEGEAFFEVTRNEQQPFVIDAQSVSVKVLGTSFNVVSNQEMADVTVVTGRVQVSTKSGSNQQVILTPGEKAHYEGSALSKGAAIGYESYWRTDSLSFNNEPFVKVLEAISEVKKATVKTGTGYSAAQLQQAITVSFKGQSLEDMLTELCLITRSRWEKQGASYIVLPK